MPSKYHIHTSQVANRFQSITRSGVIAWEEGCLKCPRCVKKDCVYKVYEKRGIDSRQMLESLDSVCKDCFRCVQGCPNKLIQKGLNPSYKALGDRYWTPEIISGLWYQSEAGRIPVSGGGYGGPFSGAGFDAMWTDMSEIVRPTRDGIHGREYISTTADIGRKLMALEFDESGSLTVSPPPVVEVPLPIILDILPWSPPRKRINLVLLEGARLLGTFAVIRQSDLTTEMNEYLPNMVLYADGKLSDIDSSVLSKLRLIELPYGKDVIAAQKKLKEKNPGLVIIIRMPLSPDASGNVCKLINEGAEVIHLVADEYGLENGEKPLFIKERMRELHLHLVDKGVRDQITLISGGGIAMAEHVAKQIICGSDLVSVDIPLLVAMECRVCRRCKEGIACPVEIESVDTAWGAGRMRNLMAGWHNQLIEILGAMGIREVRRLRGEMGRAMFFEDLEKDIFASLGRRG
ncbi:MAG TPA: glutamate synthase-related protein [Dissulfurispiraceae bacterium]|nr:glutamate synthase-related protein [Dissulfurispiraceae bacterium]